MVELGSNTSGSYATTDSKCDTGRNDANFQYHESDWCYKYPGHDDGELSVAIAARRVHILTVPI